MVALTLLPAVLLAASVAAIPTSDERHAARIARRQGMPKQPYAGISPLVSANGTENESYSSNWAGGVYNYPANSIKAVTATFVVPKPSTPPGGNSGTAYYASAWVGIDGDTCGSAILQTGLDFAVQGSSVSYSSWYEWFPAGAYDFSGISFNTGDSVTITVTASSKTSGTAVIKNNSNGQSVSKSLTSSAALCQQDVEWITEDFSSGGLVPFANFGTVAFTHTVATLTNGATIGAGNSGTIDIVNSAGQVITSTTVADGSVTIKYV